jgi:hypothetical protein
MKTLQLMVEITGWGMNTGSVFIWLIMLEIALTSCQKFCIFGLINRMALHPHSDNSRSIVNNGIFILKFCSKNFYHDH